MRKNWIWWVVAVCALLVLTLLGAGLSARPSAIGPSQRMPDGGMLTPLGFTLGTRTHRWAEGNALQRALLTMAPSGLRKLVGGSVSEYSTQSADTPVLWLRRQGGAPSFAHQISTADADGCEFEQSGSGSFASGPDEELIALPLTAFARRDPQLTVRLYTYQPDGEQRRDAEFTLPNPVRGSYPAWTAEPFPITRSDGSLSVTLDSVLTHVAQDGPPRPALTPRKSWTRLRFQARENGQPVHSWGLASVEARDATGNVVRSGSSATWQENGWTEHSVRASLCPREPAWKLRCEFSRTAGFSPQDLWTVSGISLPSKKGSTSIGQRRRMQGADIEMLELVGAEVGSRDSIGWSGSPWLHLKATGLPDDVRLSLLSVKDQAGRELHLGGSSWSGEGQHSFRFEPRPDSRAVTLTLAVHRSKHLEFTIHPGLPPAGNERKDLK